MEPIRCPDVMTLTMPSGERFAVSKGDRLSVSVGTPGDAPVSYTLRINAPVPRVSPWTRLRRRVASLFRR